MYILVNVNFAKLYATFFHGRTLSLFNFFTRSYPCLTDRFASPRLSTARHPLAVDGLHVGLHPSHPAGHLAPRPPRPAGRHHPRDPP